jgi:SAM-dependent methyltransferase
MSTLVRILRSQALAFRRRVYAARAWIPGLGERHRLESMVGPLGCWDELRVYQLRLLLENGLKPHHHLLDIGCGPLQGGVEFIKYLDPSRYVGVDIDPQRLSAAFGQIALHDLGAKKPLLLLCDKFGASHLNGRCFDFVWASQVLYYFDNQKLEELLRLLAAHLAPHGKFLGDIIGERHPEYSRSQDSAFLSRIKLQTVDQVERLAAPLGLRARSLGEIEKFGYPRRLSLRTNLLVEISRRE